MSTDIKKRLKDDYKQKLSVGAVYELVCSGNNRRWIRSTTDIQGTKNRIQLATLMKSCPDPLTRAECDKYGWDSISLVVLEELTMKKDQTMKEFSEEVKLLQELWEEKLSTAEG